LNRLVMPIDGGRAGFIYSDCGRNVNRHLGDVHTMVAGKILGIRLPSAPNR